MTISIAMCTYNGSRFLEEQLASIRTQTEQPFELIICDDGSTDETRAIVEDFRGSVSFPIRFCQNAINLGSTKNFEQAVQMCTGEFIALCDQDDIWAPEKLAVMGGLLRANQEVAGVFCNAALIDHNGRSLLGSLWQRAQFTEHKQAQFTRKHTPYALINRDTVTGATLVFRAQYVRQILPIPEEWVHDGWIALILASVAEIRPIPDCLMQYRLHVSQQVGAQVVPWYRHLYTQKSLALASHAKTEVRFAKMEEKLRALNADSNIVSYLARKVRFLKGRSYDLQRSRRLRFFSVLRKLRDYACFEKGLMSLLRDLAH